MWTELRKIYNDCQEMLVEKQDAKTKSYEFHGSYRHGLKVEKTEKKLANILYTAYDFHKALQTIR